ncbi:hypothetical protein AOQ73_13255 [Bradyrhizobium pachyrhizi]|nr:hypothetical protein AOQ73_13255 [Bradyrhizobium pachyrhizi]
MEAVGQLTGGIAHDFNNILTVITGTIEILAEAVTHNRQLTQITALIRDAAERGASLTRHLLAFARKQPLQPTTLSANNGSEALAVLDSGAPIDLLFTDVIMPGAMNGRDLATEARKRRPGLRVLFTRAIPMTPSIRTASSSRASCSWQNPTAAPSSPACCASRCARRGR